MLRAVVVADEDVRERLVGHPTGLPDDDRLLRVVGDRCFGIGGPGEGLRVAEPTAAGRSQRRQRTGRSEGDAVATAAADSSSAVSTRLPPSPSPRPAMKPSVGPANNASTSAADNVRVRRRSRREMRSVRSAGSGSVCTRRACASSVRRMRSSYSFTGSPFGVRRARGGSENRPFRGGTRARPRSRLRSSRARSA